MYTSITEFGKYNFSHGCNRDEYLLDMFPGVVFHLNVDNPNVDVTIGEDELSFIFAEAKLSVGYGELYFSIRMYGVKEQPKETRYDTVIHAIEALYPVWLAENKTEEGNN